MAGASTIGLSGVASGTSFWYCRRHCRIGRSSTVSRTFRRAWRWPSGTSPKSTIAFEDGSATTACEQIIGIAVSFGKGDDAVGFEKLRADIEFLGPELFQHFAEIALQCQKLGGHAGGSAPRLISQCPEVGTGSLRHGLFLVLDVLPDTLPRDQAADRILQASDSGRFREQEEQVVAVTTGAFVDAGSREQPAHEIEPVAAANGSALLVVMDDSQPDAIGLVADCRVILREEYDLKVTKPAEDVFNPLVEGFTNLARVGLQFAESFLIALVD